MRYVIDSKGSMPLRAEFNEIVRHTGGRARDLLLNLELGEPSSCTPEAAFGELLEEYGEREWTASPMAAFYARMQHPNESPSDYAIALEAKLRVAKEKGAGSAIAEAKARDEMLTIQFMYGLRDQDVKSPLAPMRPRDMSFRELRRELKVTDEEQKQRKGANSYRMDVRPTPVTHNNQLDEITKTLKEMHAFQEQTSSLLHQVLDDQQRSRARLDRLESLVMGPPSCPQRQPRRRQQGPQPGLQQDPTPQRPTPQQQGSQESSTRPLNA
eukprot:XP_011664820.1 PREDICTED: uncharacterized protein LOC105438551 [Strongylocentrotus purpuratus]